MSHRQRVVSHLEWSQMRRVPTIAVVAAVLAAMFATVAVAQEKATGLERASQATMQGLEKAQGNATDAPGQSNSAGGLDTQDEKLTGRERAAASIMAAMTRGNGNGNAYGRGNSTWVHEMLAAGLIPGEVKEENHGHRVRDMVRAANELRKSLRDS